MILRPLLALPARILAPLLLALLALLIGGLLYLEQLDQYSHAIEAQERLRLTERLSLEQTRLEIQSNQGNPLQVLRLVSGLGLHQGLTHAWLIDADHRVVASLSRLEAGQPLDALLDRQSLALRQAATRATHEKSARIHIYPLADESALFGHVAIYPNRQLLLRVDLAQPLAARLHAGRGEILLEAGTLLLFAVLLGGLLHLLWFRRAARLTAMASELGGGNLGARAQLEGHDELAEIGAALDTMADRIEIQHRQLSQRAYLFEHNPMPMLVYARSGLHLLAVNEAFCLQYGYRQDEALAMRLTDLYPDAEKQPIAELTAGLSDYADAGEWHHLKKDGSQIAIEAHSHDLDFKSHRARIVVINDVTDRKAAEAALRELNAHLEARVAERTTELQALNLSLESFVYSISHDLKTPLRGVEGYSRLLEEDYASRLDGEGRLFIANIRSGVAHMGKLIDDLLAYSRMERKTLSSTPIAPAQLVEQLLAERTADITAQRVMVKLDLPPGHVMADPDGLALALRNLLENALKFSARVPAPRIEIGGRIADGGFTLWVRDNGSGFDMKYHDRIFEIFQRLHRLEDYPGTGIGLALVKKAVQRMGGSVWADSAPGQGATFYLRLPCDCPPDSMA